MPKSTPTPDLIGHFRFSKQYFHLITCNKAEIIHANALFAERIAQYPVDSKMSDYIIPEDLPILDKLLQKAAEPGMDLLNFEFRYKDRSKEFLKICWEITPERKDGVPTGLLQWIGIEEHQSKEIFEQMGRTLQDIQERFKAYEFSAEGIWKVELVIPLDLQLPLDQVMEHWRTHGRITDCNDRFARMYGLSDASQLRGKTVGDVMTLDDPRMNDYFQYLVKNDFRATDLETIQADVNGNINHFLHNVICIIEDGKIARAWGTVLDITKLKRTEEKLQKSEEFYRNLITVSIDGILLVREDGTITFSSGSVHRILGYDAAKMKGENIYSFIHPEDQTTAKSIFVANSSADQAVVHDFMNLRLRHSTREWLWCQVRIFSQLQNPHIGRMIIYFSDNSERKQAEDALIASEQRFRKLIENIPVGVLLIDTEGKVVLHNQTALDLLNLKPEELQGVQVISGYDIIYEDGSVFNSEDYPISIALRTKKSVKNVVMGLRREPGTEISWLLVNCTPVLDENGVLQSVIASYANITEHRELTQKVTEQEIVRQKQLLQVTIDAQERERKEIGRELHDNISQHITITRLHLEMAKEKATGELLSSINQAHKSLLSIVNEIRMLSHSLVPPSINDIGLIASIQDLCDDLINTKSFAINLRHDGFQEELLPENMKLMFFRIIQEQINNIIRHSQATKIFISLQPIEDSVILLVEDNGTGFDPVTVKKGMGFQNIRNRVGLFGGTVRIDSGEGKGCLLEVEIPLNNH